MYRFFAVIFFLLFKNAMLLGAPPEKPNFIIILTDDQGWADFSANSPNSNLQTPNLDKLVRAGANFTNAYTSAPQCVPTRAGLLLGKVQNKLEIEKNGDSLERFAEKQNIAELLSDKGYTSALIGKWHLGPPKEIPDHGFRFFYNHISTAPFWANFSDQGALTDNQKINSSKYHIEGCSETAVTFIREFAQAPFLLFLSLRAPHVPLDAPHKYSDRFPKKLPEARRQALGMFAAIDDGIGLIQEELRRLNLTKETCIFYLSDNGAPLKLEAKNATHPALGWNGSYNAPLNGEKGMLTEGGIRVPFAISWPGKIPPGSSYDHPVTSLDIAPTILEQVGIEKEGLDGINLLPYLRGNKEEPPHEFLCWRWIAQAAIRAGKWKFLKCEDREYLFNLEEDLSERENLIHQFPLVSVDLEKKLLNWAQGLNPPGLKNGELPELWVEYFDYHLGKE